MIEIKPRYPAKNYTADTSFTLTVSGVADMPSMNSGTGKCFQPERLTLEYRYSSEFGQWAMSTWSVRGPIRLKSGELSDRSTGQQYGWSFGDSEPTWVAAAIERYKPTGVITYHHVTIKDGVTDD